MTDQRWTLRNIARRPIELHEAAEVYVLAADETIEVDVIGDNYTALIARGLMTAHPASIVAASHASTATTTTRAERKRKPPTKTVRRKGEGA